MAITITSYSPSTGPNTGGTNVVIIGTGLDTVTDVDFGTYHGTINTAAAGNSSTQLTVISPGVPATYVTPVKITLVDTVGGVSAQSATNYTYTAVTSPILTSTVASKWILQVDSSVALDGSGYIPVRGMTSFQPAVASTNQDDSDYDSGAWGSDAKTQLKWSNVLKLSRKRAAGYVEDPGQAVLRAAHDQVGAPSTIRCRWYDRNGHGSEAYEGYALVDWSEDGGATTALSMVSVTLMGQGVRTKITNPVS